MKISISKTKWVLNTGVLMALIIFGSCKCKPNGDKGDGPDDQKETNIFDKINAKGEILVGFEPDAPPLYFEESGVKKGFDYELITFLSKEVFEGVSVSPIADGYDELPKHLKEGKIDLMAGGRTDEENSEELYSDPYLSFGFCIITKKSSSKKFNDLYDLNKAKIGVYDDYAAQWIKEKVPSADITIIGDREDENTLTSDWMSGIIDGEFDVIIYDYPFATNEIVDYDNKLVISNNNINGDELNEYVLVLNRRMKGAQELIEKINDGIKKFKESSKYSDAIVEYIPVTIKKETTKVSSDSYTIKRGETLSILARDHLGDVNKWEEIYQINKAILASPDIIYPGQIISKPEGWK